MLQFLKKQIEQLDDQIEKVWRNYAAQQNGGELTNQSTTSNSQKKKHGHKNDPNMDVRSYVSAILGTDVMEIYGIASIGALEILAETGTDMNKWPTEKHFVSWLSLCPNTKISGGKILSSRIRKGSGAAGQAFRNAANAAQNSKSWLGDYFRRKKTKAGKRYAIVATANKIATIYYKMIKNKEPFVPMEITDYQHKRNQHKIAYMKRKIEQLESEMAQKVIS